MAHNNWTRDETIVALYLYYIIPFQKVRKSNATVQEYAALLQRTPSALGMKIGNLGRFDSTLKMQNIVGLSNGSKLDAAIWQEFAGNWAQLSKEFERIVQQRQAEQNANTQNSPTEIPLGRERITRISVRVNQGFFRASVLAAYNNQCCITGLQQPELLIASHIKPWKDDEQHRLNPQNGLCLNALHDKAFDRGLISLSEDFRVLLSPKLHNQQGFDLFFKPFANQSIALPERLSPDLELLRFHREHIFQY